MVPCAYLGKGCACMSNDGQLGTVEDEPKRRLWFALWRNIQECRVSPKLFERNMFAVEMPLGGDRHLGFPFSSIVAQVLAETRDHVENTGNTLAILEQHVGGKLPVLLDPRMCTEEMVSLFLRDYLSLHPLTSEHGQQDFCAIFLRITEGCDFSSLVPFDGKPLPIIWSRPYSCKRLPSPPLFWGGGRISGVSWRISGELGCAR